MSLLTDVSDRFKAELAADDAAANARLAQSYAAAYQRMQVEVDRVAAKIQRARDRGEEPDVAWLFRVGRLAELQAQAAGEMGRYGQDATRLITSAQNTLVDRAGSDAEELVRTSLGDPARPVWMKVGWNRVPTDTLTDLVGSLSDGSPLSDLFNGYGPRAAETLKQTLVTGVAMGRNPRVIARDFRENMGGDMTRALVVARTESLRSYREASRRNYHTNSDVVNGWVWLASLTARTCPMCWTMNGTHHGNEETLDGHPCCRCSMVPDTKSLAELGLPEDEEWPANDIPLGSTVFDQQPDQVQLDVLGPTNFRLYKEGRVRLEDFVGRKENEVWGSMRYTLSSGRALAKAAATDNPLQAGLKELDPEAFKARKAAQTRVFHLRKKLAAEGWDKDAIEAEVRKRVPEAFEATKPAPGIVTPPIKPEPNPMPPATSNYLRVEQTTDAASKWSKDNFAEWQASLTTDEKSAVRNYSRSEYEEINPFLRGEAEGKPHVLADIKSIDAALEKATLRESVLVYRGLGDPFFRKNFDSLVGHEFIDEAYGSTSLLEAKARAYSSGVVAEIRLSAGFHAAGIEDLSHYGSEEAEMLLPRGTKFRVVETRLNENGRKIAVMEIVPGNELPPPPEPPVIKPEPPLPPIQPTPTDTSSVKEFNPSGMFPEVQAANAYAATWDQWTKDLSDDERRALRSYKGAGFEDINFALRYPNTPQQNQADIEERIAQIDKAMARATTPDSVRIWRGVKGGPIADGDAASLVGTTFEDKAYGSWTINKKVAIEFSDASQGAPKATLIDVVLPKGHSAVFADNLADITKEEHELLLPRGIRYRIKEVKDGEEILGGPFGDTKLQVRRVTLEIVPGEEVPPTPPVIPPPLPEPPVIKPEPPLPPAPGNLKPVKGGVLIIDPADPANVSDPAEIKRLKRNAYSRAYKMNERLLAEGKSPEEAAAIVRKMVPEAFGGTGVINPDPVIVPPGPKPVIESPPPIKPTVVPPPPPEPQPPIEPPKPTPRLALKNISKMSFVKQNELIADLAKMGYTPDEIAESLGVTVDRVQRLVDAVKRNEEFDAEEKARTEKERAEKAAGRPKPVMTGQKAVDHLDKTLDAFKVERNDATKARQEVVDKLTELSKQRMSAKVGSLQSDVLDKQWNEQILRRNHWDDVLADIKKREKSEVIDVLFPADREAATFKTFVDVSSIKGPDRGRVEREIEKGAEWVRSVIGKGRLDSDTVNFDKADAGRANYNHRMRTVNVEGKTDATVVAHELGHWVENMERQTRKAAHDFFARRTNGETAQSLKKLTGLRYDAAEVAKPDKFINPYMGKVYTSDDTEIVSMGFELMMKDPIDFYRKDKDMFAFIYDIIQGAHL